MRIKSILIGLLIVTSAVMQVEASGSLSNAEAMFIYNFLRHVNWPDASNGETFVIGIYGDNQVFEQLQRFTANRKVGMKNIVVRNITTANDASVCQLVFVPESQTSKITEIRNKLGNQACLVVSEREGTLASGSTIEFVIVENKLRFRISEERAKQQNLMISKALLDMAV
jgi:hypothetical protein